MLEFRTALRDRIMSIISTTVGPTSPSQAVKLIDKRLHDVDRETQLPFVVVTVRSLEPAALGPAEIGNPLSSQDGWLVHIYYLDMDANWDTGDTRQTVLSGAIIKELLRNYNLSNLSSTDAGGQTEYALMTKLTHALFDSTGVEGDYSFVSELYLTVYTDRR